MRAHKGESGLAGTAPAEEGATDPFSEAAAGHAVAPMREMFALAQERARRMLEAEDALRSVGERYQRAEDPEVRAELAVEGLDCVERQLSIARGRRQQLDSIEGNLWARRNRLERFLIHTRGRAWWHAHRKPAEPEAFAADPRQP
jgi:hypothetical protein